MRKPNRYHEDLMQLKVDRINEHNARRARLIASGVSKKELEEFDAEEHERRTAFERMTQHP